MILEKKGQKKIYEVKGKKGISEEKKNQQQQPITDVKKYWHTS